MKTKAKYCDNPLMCNNSGIILVILVSKRMEGQSKIPFKKQLNECANIKLVRIQKQNHTRSMGHNPKNLNKNNKLLFSLQLIQQQSQNMKSLRHHLNNKRGKFQKL